MFSKSFFAIALLALSVVAQETSSPIPSGTETSAVPSSTAGISPCILGCVAPAAADAGCSSPADLPCVCTSTTFQQAAKECLSTKCTAEEQQAALTLQTQECAAIASSAPVTSGTVSGTASSHTSEPTKSASATSPASSGHASTTASGSAASATKSSAAMGLEIGTGLVGAAVLGLLGFAL